MKYTAAINRRFRYVRVYNIVKRANRQGNAVSDLMEKFVNRYLLKRKSAE